MADSSPTTRSALLKAGRALAERQGTAAALSPEDVCAEACLASPEFVAQFADLSQFQQALLLIGLDEVRGALIQITLNEKPGLKRLTQAIVRWLDVNVERPWVRELILLHSGDSVIADTVRKRTNGLVLLAQVEFESTGRERAAIVARVLSGLMIETALAEYDARRALPDLRATLLAFVERT